MPRSVRAISAAITDSKSGDGRSAGLEKKVARRSAGLVGRDRRKRCAGCGSRQARRLRRLRGREQSTGDTDVAEDCGMLGRNIGLGDFGAA